MRKREIERDFLFFLKVRERKEKACDRERYALLDREAANKSSFF